MQDVTVFLGKGESIQGQLSREWDKTWVLETGDGTRHFLGNDMPTIAYKVDPDREGNSIFDHWRSFLPFLLVSLASLLMFSPWKLLLQLRNYREL